MKSDNLPQHEVLKSSHTLIISITFVIITAVVSVITCSPIKAKAKKLARVRMWFVTNSLVHMQIAYKTQLVPARSA